jgi:hypothetical protein
MHRVFFSFAVCLRDSKDFSLRAGWLLFVPLRSYYLSTPSAPLEPFLIALVSLS